MKRPEKGQFPPMRGPVPPGCAPGERDRVKKIIERIRADLRLKNGD